MNESSKSTNPVELLDAAIHDLETHRRAALQAVKNANGRALLHLLKAVALLDEMLLEARSRRIDLVKRAERTSRMREVAESLRAIHAELSGTAIGPERQARLQEQAAALHEEVAVLTAPTRGDSDTRR